MARPSLVQPHRNHEEESMKAVVFHGTNEFKVASAICESDLQRCDDFVPTMEEVLGREPEREVCDTPRRRRHDRHRHTRLTRQHREGGHDECDPVA